MTREEADRALDRLLNTMLTRNLRDAIQRDLDRIMAGVGDEDGEDGQTWL